MKSATSVLSLVTASALAAILGWTPALTRAAQTDLAQTPLGTAQSATVLPNLMYILDNSESMTFTYLPDEVQIFSPCKVCSGPPNMPAGACRVAGTACLPGMPPYHAAPFNMVYYDPKISYKPGVDSLGVSMGNANPAAATDNIYLSPGGSATNLTTTWPETVWCDTAARAGTDLTGGVFCKRNGIHTPATFTYDNVSMAAPFAGGFPVGTGSPATTTAFNNPIILNTNAHYYDITPREHCTDTTLATCTLSPTPTGLYVVPALVRWCLNSGGETNNPPGAASVTAVTGGSPNPSCQSKWSNTYKVPRLGKMTRTDIKPGNPTYPLSATAVRPDCTTSPGVSCTYAEELQNFANWYTYYHTRALLMKTSTGHAFLGLDDRYRVGFVTITIKAPASSYYLKIDKFTPSHKNAWYNTLYASPHSLPADGTPLKAALSRVGRHYAGKTDLVNSTMPDDPVQFSCQQNFALLTTDGYYGGAGNVSFQLDGKTVVGNQDDVIDKVAPFNVTRASGTFDGSLKLSTNTLADVAMYYYKNDLRDASWPAAISKNNVPTTPKDGAPHQHMVTFTLGLGLEGVMTYRPDYETAVTGDFASIKAGNPSCSWGNPCDWPEPVSGQSTTIDDTWHAAVNGRGVYYSAKNPLLLQTGLASALSTIQITTGAAASSATSTPNITPTDNFIYSSTYRSVKWDGEVVAERIDATTGNVIAGAVWAAGAQLDARVSANSDTRTIYTLDPADATDKLKPFLHSNLSAAEKAHFDNKCALLSQCSSLSPGQQNQANSSANLVKWLRGQTGDAGTLFRARDHVLGDVVNAQPAFVGKPNLLYGDAVVPDYSSFKTANASRQPVLYIPANDGMLHAFNANTGAEMWAYVPRMLFPDLYKLAGTNYGSAHRYYVDGSPITMDVFFSSTSTWKTILVGGLNSGGRGYYALDVTDPNNPKGLWEVCADPSGTLQCTHADDNIGFTFGQPIITKDPLDGKWVVIASSGYNNVSPGDGKGHLYIIDAETGTIRAQATTSVGDNSTPSGFAKITGFATNFAVNNTTTVVYGGDLFGNMFSIDVPSRVVRRIGQAKDAGGKMQSITTRPDVTRFDSPAVNVVYVGTGRLLAGTDLLDPATLSPPVLDLAYQQTVYGFKDTGADLGILRAPGAKLVQQVLSVIDTVSRTISNNAVDWSTQNGWWVDLNPVDDSPGERVNIDPQLVTGVLLVATNEPNNDACSSGGDSRFYQFDFRSGSYIASAPGAVVGVKLGSALTAGFVVYRLPSGQLKYTSVDVTGMKRTDGVAAGAGGLGSSSRASWRELYQ